MKYVVGLILVGSAMVALGEGQAQAQVAGCPDINFSMVVQDIFGDTALLILPDGSGPPLTSAYRSDRVQMDASITLTLYSSCPPTGAMVDYPAEDMWLESTSGSLVFCAGGSIADGPTDAQGITTWTGPLSGGGWDSGSLMIFLATGDALGFWNLPLLINSPDLNGDLTVNLQDVALFAGDFFSPQYDFRSDLHYDHVVNLSDLSVMTGVVGKSCP